MSDRSASVESALATTLPNDLRDWIDSGLDELASESSYNEASARGASLDPSAVYLWGGQHLPDSLPLLTNGGGDCVLVRFGWDGRVREYVEWLHEGGMWRTYGDSLAEALVLNACSAEAYSSGLDVPQLTADTDPWFAWACRTLAAAGHPLDLATLRRASAAGRFEHLLERGVAAVAARQQLAGFAMWTPLGRWMRSNDTTELTTRLGVPFATLSEWTTCLASPPPAAVEAITMATGIAEEELFRLDTEHAVSHARAAAAMRPDLAWPHAIEGFHHERLGDPARAVRAYARAIGTPTSTLWMTTSAWPGWNDGRFLARRLTRLSTSWPPDVGGREYVDAVLVHDWTPQFPGTRVRRYWLEVAEEAEHRQDYRAAYEAYLLLGWDHFITNNMEEILERMAVVAEKGGAEVLARLARAHLWSLQAMHQPRSPSALPQRRGWLSKLASWLGRG